VASTMSFDSPIVTSWSPSSTIWTPTVQIQRTGITPGDFIKPDPGLTNSERRQYILEEMKRWLCSPQMTAMVESMVAEDVSLEDVRAGMFPAGRIYLILKHLDPSDAGIWGAREVGHLCYSICVDNLQSGNSTANNDILDLVLGFLDVDRLPDGRTIRDLWNTPAFQALREAPPLPEEVEVEEVEEAAEAEDEAEEVEGEAEEAKPSFDDKLDGVFNPTGLLVAGLALIVSYVAVLLTR